MIEDAGELGGESAHVLLGEGDAGKPGDMEDFFGRERHLASVREKRKEESGRAFGGA